MGALENTNVFKTVSCNLSFPLCNDELTNVTEVETGPKIVRTFTKSNKKFTSCTEIQE